MSRLSLSSGSVVKAAIRRTFFSDLFLSLSAGRRIAYVAVMTALCIAANMGLEFRMADTQFSLTIAVSVLTGIVIGPAYGFLACFLGDFLGYIVNTWGLLYMPWVGLATGATALLAGLVFNLCRCRFRGAAYVKLAIVCILTFLFCTVGINSTGFYLYNKGMGFSAPVVDYVSRTFGSEVSFFGYVAYRLIFKLQILNNLFNYAVLFVAVPLLNNVKPLKIHIG